MSIRFSDRVACWLPALLFALVVSSLPAQTVLVDFGDDWRFLRGTAEASDPVTAWRDAGFDDQTWETGPTGIGYSDDDDATVLDDMQGNYTTVYLRKTFNAANPGAATTLVLGVNYDDGFVCYVNGVEVARANAGTAGTDLDFDATAGGNHEAGTAEFFDLSASLGELSVGENLIAVQLLNTSLTSSDLSFDARLAFDDPSLDCPTDLTCTRAVDGVTLSWTNGPALFDSIAVLRDGQPIPGSPFPGDTTSVIDSAPGDFENEYEVIAGTGGFACSPLRCTTDSAFDFVLEGDDWQYFKGTEEPPADWIESDFDDSLWEVGPTGIGYADGDDATLLDDMMGAYMSVYCRRTFDAPDPAAIHSLQLLIDYDDGYIAYLNGVEVARSASMGAPGEAFAFDAPATAGREAGTASRVDVSAALGELVEGANVLAVQVHNTQLGSSDLSFIPELSANECAIRGLACALDEVADEVTLAWDAGTFDGFEVTRNGEPLPGSPFPAGTTSAVDDAPAPRDNVYEVNGILGGVMCTSDTCTIDCSVRMPDALTCTLELVDGFTAAALSWDTVPGAVEIEVEREGALIATLGPDETSYIDPDVEIDEAEEDTGFDVIFVFGDGTTCTLTCNESLCPDDLACEVIDQGGTPRVRLSWGNVVKNWVSLGVERDGLPLTDLPGDATEFIDTELDLEPGQSHDYSLVPVAPLGGEVGTSCDSTCTVALPIPELGEPPAPTGGWDYAIDFAGLGALSYAQQTGVAGNLDGEWIRSVDRDEWDGSEPFDVGAAPAGPAPGGIGLATVAGGGACGGSIPVLRILNPGDPSNPGATLATVYPEPFDAPNNRTLFLGLELGQDPGNLLRDGLTFAARWRLTPQADVPEYLAPNEGGDGTSVSNGLGHVGAYFIDDGTIGTEGASASLGFALQSAGAIQMTTAPATNVGAVDVTEFRTVWVTVEDPEADDTYDVKLYLGGDSVPFTHLGTTPHAALQTPNADFGFPGTFLAIGVPDGGGDADLQLDFVAYAEGVHAPARASCGPPGELRFRRGDGDDSGGSNITDAIAVLNHLFASGPRPSCWAAADANGDGGVNVSDPVYQLNHLFGGGDPIPPPGPDDCGPGTPDDDDLGCDSYTSC